MTIALRPMLPADLPALAALFKESILTLCADDYSEEQLDTWSEQAEMPRFDRILSENLTLLAHKDRVLAGFATLQKDTIAMLYVHPDFALQGIASALVDALEKLANARRVAKLNVDASETAYGFFARRGYQPMARNSVALGDVWLANTSMTKPLTESARLP